MKARTPTGVLLGFLVLAIVCAVAVRSGADHHEKDQEHADNGQMNFVNSDDIEWQSGPASLPSGAEFAVLEGDPTKPGLFTMRLKAPDGYRIPPHTHPKVERVTVIEGTFRLGMAREFDQEKLKDLEAGGFFTMPPGMEHFAEADGETIIQLNGEGPWEINYLNPSDDPRRQRQ